MKHLRRSLSKDKVIGVSFHFYQSPPCVTFLELGNRGRCLPGIPRPLAFSKPGEADAATGLPRIQAPLLAWLSGRAGAQQGGSQAPAADDAQHPASHSAEKILGSISGALKEPPGFTHLTGNKRPTERLGFCSEVCFLSVPFGGRQWRWAYSPSPSDFFP